MTPEREGMDVNENGSATIRTRVPRGYWTRYVRTIDYFRPIAEAHADVAAGRVTYFGSDDEHEASLRSRMNP